MGYTRHTGVVAGLVVVTSIVAGFAVQHCYRTSNRQVSSKELPISSLSDDEVKYFESAPSPSKPNSVRFDSGLRQAAQSDAEISESGDGRPKPVPQPLDAVPIEEHDAQVNQSPAAKAVRSVIDHELSDSSREERDIWFHELKSLPAPVVQDLLRVRKQLRTLGPSKPIPQIASREKPLVAEPVVQSRRTQQSEWNQTQAAIEQAIALTRFNLTNSTTPGFKRLRVFFVDSAIRGSELTDTPSGKSPLFPAEGIKLAPVLIDVQQGAMQRTERSLDWAIDGDGYFVGMKDDQPVYTRCGAFMLDSQRRICLIASESPIVLQPVMTIPAAAREIQVNANGQVNALTKIGDDPVAVGKLQLARFASPARLRPVGGTLLSPTTDSGPAEVGAPDEEGRGTIQQGCLERSNVESEAEMANIQEWQSMLKLLPVSNHPVTARGADASSR